MRRFDYSFLCDDKVPARIVNLLTGLYSMKEKNISRMLKYEKIYTELERIAKVQSIKYSNAIEGIITTDERINAIVNQNSAPLNHDEQEIAGYRDALNTIHQYHKVDDFKETDIKKLHNLMMILSSYEAGEYKTSDNVIMEVWSDGTRHIRFTPISASETEEAMHQWYLAYIDARDNSKINRLLLIPCVILDFLCIHPFADGNGRVSRLLSLLLLYHAGFDVGKYISFEEQINKNKNMYYESLRKSSIGWHENTNDYYYFIENFITNLFLCYKELDKRFTTVNSTKVTKANRIEATVLESILPISKKEISMILPDVSPTTIEAVLGKMVKEGKIKKVGAASQTHYVKK